MQKTIQHFFDPQTSTFSYLVYQGLGSSAIIIDSVLNYDHRSGRTHTHCADQLIVFVKEQQLRVEWILETHAHADHLSAAPYLKKYLGGQIVIGKDTPRRVWLMLSEMQFLLGIRCLCPMLVQLGAIFQVGMRINCTDQFKRFWHIH